MGYAKNDIITLGGMDWRVVALEEDRTLIVACHTVEELPFHAAYVEATWETCSLRAWLNGPFLERFSAEERHLMLESSLATTPSRYGVSGGNDTVDTVFCLSVEEARQYFTTDQDRACGERWWLRTRGVGPARAVYARHDGYINDHGWGPQRRNGVRPAIWIKAQ